MATLTAVKSGSFHDPTVWDLGYVPGAGDTAKPASYVITISADVTCALLDGTGQNGCFQCSTPGVTITADVWAGNVSLLRFSHSSGVCTVNGTVTGGSRSSAYGASNNSSGTINITTAIGGSGHNACGANNNSSGTINITTAIGGSGSYTYGADNSSSGTINVTTAIGGSGSSAYGAYNYSSGTVNVTTATGGSGPGAHGAYIYSNGTLNVGRAIGNDYGPGGSHSNSCYGVVANNTVGQITTVEEIEFGPYGQSPIAGPVLLRDVATNQAQFRLAYGGAAKTLHPLGAAADYPAEADVRNGVKYDFDDKTGTCAVPLPQQVAYGVPVDDTVGVAFLRGSDVWSYIPRTLTMTAAEMAAAVSGLAISIHRGDTWSWSLTGLGNISARTKLYFTLKSSSSYTDAEALVQIEETAGLLRLNGAAVTDATLGDITVNNATNGDITITLKAAATAQLQEASNLVYDVQIITPDGVDTLTQAKAKVTADVTRAVT